MRACRKCNTPKEIICFGKDKSQKDGLNRICKECKRTKDGQYLFKNKEKKKEYLKEYYQNNKDSLKTQNKEYKKGYRKNNKEKIKKYKEKQRF